MKGWTVLAAWATVWAVLAVVPLAVFWRQMPDPVASHWGIAGAPDAGMPLAMLPVVILGLVLFGALLSGLMRNAQGPSAEAYAIAGGIGGLAVAVGLSTALLNRGATAWDQARSMSLWMVLLMLVSMSAGGLAGYVIGRRVAPRIAPDVDSPPVLAIDRSELAAWVGTARVRWPWILVGLGVVALVFLPGWFRLIGVATTFLGTVFTSLEVHAGPNGLQVRATLFPLRHIPLAEIGSARPIDLAPSQWGGWGYRIIPGGSAIVIRAGDALELNLESGRRFAVTVDDAATGAAVLNGYLALARN